MMFTSIVDNSIIPIIVMSMAFIIAVGLLIAIHEFGHFWMARRCGVHVQVFSLGFGKTLWQHTDRHGTLYRIALIPLGGYVKMLDERNEAVPEALLPHAFNTKRVGQRAAIVAAGPIANLILALLFFWLVNIIGQPVMRAIVADVLPDSIAAQAGVKPNEIITSWNGKPVESWQQIATILAKSPKAETALMTVKTASSDVTRNIILPLNTRNDETKEPELMSLGILPSLGQIAVTITGVLPDSPAEKAALQVGDKLLAFAGQTINHPMMLIEQIKARPNQTVMLTIERTDGQHTLPITLAQRATTMEKVEGVAGFTLATKVVALPDSSLTYYRLNPLNAFSEAVQQCWQLSRSIIDGIIKMIIGKGDLGSVAGPVTLAKVAGKSVQLGINSYLKFLAIVSLNLGIINLFPLPILDGGHLLFLSLEKIIGRPVSMRVQNYGYRIGICILIMLMGLAFFNDFTQL